MKHLTRRAVSVGLALTAAGAINIAMGSPAPAAVPSVKTTYTCNGTPSIKVIAAGGGVYNWTMSGTGVCYTPTATFGLQMSGAGTSTGAGLCSSSSPIIQSFDVVANLTMTRQANGQVFNYTEHFTSPVSLFPVSVPFAVTDSDGDTIGAGAAFTRIFAKCGTAGTDDGSVVWTQTS